MLNLALLNIVSIEFKHPNLREKRDYKALLFLLLFHAFEKAAQIKNIQRVAQTNFNEIIPGLYLGGVKCQTPEKYLSSYKFFIKELFEHQSQLIFEKIPIAKIHKIIGCMQLEIPQEWGNTRKWTKGHLEGNTDIERVYLPIASKSKDIKDSFSHFIAIASGVDCEKSSDIAFTYWNGDHNIGHFFERTFQEVDLSLQLGQNVYIHCRGGKTRSAALVVAYLMKRQRVSFQQAYNYVMWRRPVVRLSFFNRRLKSIRKEDSFD